MESQNPQGVREAEIRRSQAWVERDGQSPIEGEVLFLDQRDGKRAQTKKIGVVAGASGRKPAFKIHGHQQGRKQANWERPEPGLAGAHHTSQKSCIFPRRTDFSGRKIHRIPKRRKQQF